MECKEIYLKLYIAHYPFPVLLSKCPKWSEVLFKRIWLVAKLRWTHDISMYWTFYKTPMNQGGPVWVGGRSCWNGAPCSLHWMMNCCRIFRCVLVAISSTLANWEEFCYWLGCKLTYQLTWSNYNHWWSGRATLTPCENTSCSWNPTPLLDNEHCVLSFSTPNVDGNFWRWPQHLAVTS